VLAEMFRALKLGGDIVVMDVVQQKKLSKNILLQIYHTLVELRTANYVNMMDIKREFNARTEDFNMQLDMFGLVALVWGKKRT